MSERYPGGIITKNPATPTGPYETGTAPGIWTLEQQLQYKQQGVWPIAGNVPNYIEDVFQTWLYSGNSSTQSIVNGINLSTNGGMVWTKSRNAAYDNTVYDTARGTGSTKALYTDTTDAQGAFPSFQDLTAYNTNGYSIGSPILLNETGKTYVSWTFREQPKFFDVVTYTGTGASQTVSHSLNGTVGALIIKKTSGTGNWATFTRTSGAAGSTLYAYFNSAAGLNLTAAANATGVAAEAAGIITTTSFNPNDLSGSGASGNVNNINDSGATYVAYIFAHDAGGFGLSGTDNVISCGSVTTNGSGNATVNLGYEPQWLLSKWTTTADNWHVYDDMRGWSTNVNGTSSNTNDLFPNSADAETNRAANEWYKTSTGFNIYGSGSSRTYIYIAIRRGPMKVPTSGTTVFNGIARTGTGANASITTVGFPPDLLLGGIRSPGGLNYTAFEDKLRGANQSLQSGTTGAEFAPASISVSSFDQNGYSVGPDTGITNYNDSGVSYITWALRRAPSFFDEVCYTGTGVTLNVTHNLAAVPELMIVKGRNSASAWDVYSQPTGNTNVLRLSTTAAASVQPQWNDTTPTSTVFTVKGGETANVSGRTYVAYLFATTAGVSKVGSYTGNGSTQTINCGFGAGGARFVLIKRTDDTGDWYVYDTIRGMTVLTDPYLLWNSTNAESATLGSVTTVSTGFALNSAILAAINVNAGTYIFLAIA